MGEGVGGKAIQTFKHSSTTDHRRLLGDVRMTSTFISTSKKATYICDALCLTLPFEIKKQKTNTMMHIAGSAFFLLIVR